MIRIRSLIITVALGALAVAAFQNCSPAFQAVGDPAQVASSASMTNTTGGKLSLKVHDALNVAAPVSQNEILVTGVPYGFEVIGDAATYAWSISSSPASACSFAAPATSATESVTCAQDATVVVSVEAKDQDAASIGTLTFTRSSLSTAVLAPTGQTLYTTNCASCHNQLAGSTILRVTPDAIVSALATSTHSKVAALSNQDVRSIAAALNVAAPNANCKFNGLDVRDGQAIAAYKTSSVPFGQTCASEQRVCHNGQLSGSNQFTTCAPVMGASCKFHDRTVVHGETIDAYPNANVAYGVACTPERRTCNNGVLSGTATNETCTPADPVDCQFNGQTIKSGVSIIAYDVATVPFGFTCDDKKNTRTCTNGVMSGKGEFVSCVVTAGNTCTFNGQTISSGSSVQAFETSTVPYGSTCKSEQRACSNGTLGGSFTKSSCTVAPAAQ